MSEETVPRFTPEAIQNAFEKAKICLHVEGGVLRMMTDKDTDAVIDFYRHHFFPDDIIAKSIGMELRSEMEAMLVSVLKQNISCMAVCEATGEIMSCRLIGIARNDEDIDISSITYDKFLIVYNFMTSLLEKADLFNRFGVTEMFDLYGLGTNKKFRQRGIATKLMNAALVFLKELKSDIVWVKGEGTSNFSQSIYEKLGFETITKLNYADYIVDGEVVIKNTGEHKSQKVYVKRVDQ